MSIIMRLPRPNGIFDRTLVQLRKMPYNDRGVIGNSAIVYKYKGDSDDLRHSVHDERAPPKR